MEVAFSLKEGEVGTSFNHDQSVAYVMRLVRHVLPREQLQQIAEIKMADLNALDMDAAIRIIAGTARSMGLEVVE